MAPIRFAKLTRPRTDGLLRRTRLFEQLDRASSKPLVWLSAPPGAGKTSLAATWVDERGMASLWYQLDANDGDPATFFHYLREAAGERKPGRAKPLPAFRAEHLADLPAFARLLFRSLFQWLDHGVLVLDNFQDLPETSVLFAALEAGFDEAPEGAHVLAISRTRPPPAFARLRAGQRIAFLDWDQIRLTVDEATAMAGAGGRPSAEALSGHTIAEIFDQTDGWAAGLVLMLERLRQTGQLRRLRDTENLDTVFDYFASQVFDAAPAAQRDMLTRMSYLPQMTAELAQAITGDAAAGPLLASLARRNLFTDRRLAEDTSYQFHALFRVFLQTRAREGLGHSEHLRLTNSAAALLQTSGQIEDAFALYVEAAEWEPAIRLILKEAGRLVQQGRRQTLRHWIQSLPMDRSEADPWLSYWLAVSQLGSDYPGATRALERAYEGFEATSDTTGRVLTACRAVDISHAVVPAGANLGLWMDRLEALLDTPESLEPTVYCEGRVMLLQACFRLRPFTRQCSVAAERLEAVLYRCDDDLYVAAAGRLIWFWHHHGDRQRAQAFFDESRHRLPSPEVREPTALFWHQPAMQHAFALGEFDLASRLAEETRHLVDDSGCVPDIVEFERLTSVVVSFTRGVTAAQQYLQERVAPRLESAAFFTRVYTRLLQALYAYSLRHHETSLAQALDGLSLAQRAGETSMAYRYLATMCAFAFAGNRRFDEARDFARRITEGTEQGHNAQAVAWRRQAEIYVQLLERPSEPPVGSIRDHLSYIRSTGYVRLAANSGRVSAEILSAAFEAGIEPEYCREVVRTARYRPPAGAGPSWPWPVRLRVLGGFVLDGETVQKRGVGRSASRTLDLLKALIASGAEAVPCTELADAVWPESDGAAAMRAFEVTLTRLRKVLGRDDAVRVRDGRASLDESCCWLDSQAFEVAAAQAAGLSDDDPAVDTTVGKALSLYRGPLLAGEEESAVLLAARDRLRARWLTLVRRRVRRAAEREAWRDMSELCRDALAIEPTLEDLLRHRISSLDRLGERTEALAAYRAGAEQLRLRLGVAPSAETEALHRSMLGG